MPPVSLEAARKAKDRVLEMVAPHAEVTGIGLTQVEGSYAVRVNLRREAAKILPQEIDGVPLLYVTTGAIRPL
jgi:hypothetical protein